MHQLSTSLLPAIFTLTACWSLLVLPAQAGDRKLTGFVPGTVGATPVQGQHKDDKIQIVSPETAVVIVYNHGSGRPYELEDCSATYRRVPDSILAQRSEAVHVYYICSKTTEPKKRRAAGENVFKRAREIEKKLDELIELGISPQRIFVAGHSHGGWSSLMLMSMEPTKLNAVIAFAPAMAGKRSEYSQYPWWRDDVRPRHVKKITGARRMDALVFAYKGDAWERPEDLAFLPEAFPQSVELVSYGCPGTFSSHLIAFNDCKYEETAALIGQYIQKRLGGETAKLPQSSDSAQPTETDSSPRVAASESQATQVVSVDEAAPSAQADNLDGLWKGKLVHTGCTLYDIHLKMKIDGDSVRIDGDMPWAPLHGKGSVTKDGRFEGKMNHTSGGGRGYVAMEGKLNGSVIRGTAINERCEADWSVSRSHQ